MAFPPVCQRPGTFTFFVGETFIDLIETPDRDFNGFDDRRPSASTVQHNIAPADLRTGAAAFGKIAQGPKVAVFVPARTRASRSSAISGLSPKEKVLASA
jgi:hypothetical protein